MSKTIAYTTIFEAVRKVVPSIVQIYLVGGAVRDIVLGKPVHDYDFVIEGLVRPVGKKLADELKGKYYVLDDERDMVRIILNQDVADFTCIDLSPLRGHSLEDDLYLRDFTINAMAIDFMEKNAIIDPMGGAADLKEKTLRMCNLESIKSDPLRGMRAIRMAVEYELTMDNELIKALKEIKPYLSAASIERYRDELFKILSLRKESAVLEMMDKFGFLDYLFPSSYETDMQKLTERIRSAEHLNAILTKEFNESESSNLLSGLAVLKLGQFRKQLNEFFYCDQSLIHERASLLLFGLIARLFRTENDPEPVQKILKSRSKHLLLSTAEINVVLATYHAMLEAAGLFSSETYSDTVIYRYFLTYGSAGVDGIFMHLIELHAQRDQFRDSVAWTNALDHAERFLDAWFNKQKSIIAPKPLLSGKEIQEVFAIPAGPEVGRLKQIMIEGQIDGKISNQDEAIELLKQQAAER